MALVSGYSSSEDEDSPQLSPQALKRTRVVAAPEVTADVSLTLHQQPQQTTENTSMITAGNAGFAIKETVDEYTFETQRRTFEQMGYAQGIHGDGSIVGDLTAAHRHQKRDITELRSTKKDSKRIKKRRVNKGKVGGNGDDAYAGPWAKYKSSSEDEDDDEEQHEEQESEQDQEEKKNLTSSDNDSDSEDEYEEENETTEFLGSQERDYQGRTYMHPPNDVGINLNSDSGPEECFVPKKQLHKWKGHAHGTTKITFIPKTNHLLLSCGNDSKIYLWGVYHKRELLRAFYGHTKPVRDISFNSDGKQFLSASYDKTVKLWNTETGECLARFKLTSVPNVIKFNVFNDDEFIVGLMNHKILHYSISKKEIIQTYDHHLGSINSITFLDDGETKRFVSTSEDKTARVWDLQVNIPVKLISDPTLHSMPVTRVHPSGKYFAAQSMDNTVMVFGASGRYKTNKKKLFEGHNCAGFGIGIDFSPDGKILVSGDSAGNAIFWDWKTCKVVTKLKVDTHAITQVCWNTKEVSKVALTGVDGAIYYYG